MRFNRADLTILVVLLTLVVINISISMDDPVVVDNGPAVLLYGPEIPPQVYFRMGMIQMSHSDEVYDCAVNSMIIGGDIIFHRECIEIVYGVSQAEVAEANRGPTRSPAGITHLVR